MQTLLGHLSQWADEDPNATAQAFKKKGKWQKISARQYKDCIYEIALFLESRGFNNQSILAIFSFNCPQWVHSGLAAILLRAKAAGLYPNASAQEALTIIKETQTGFLAVQNKTYFEKLKTANHSKDTEDFLNSLTLILVFEGDTSFSSKAISYEAALQAGQEIRKKKETLRFSDYLNALNPHDPAFMIYTSGTTGSPKGAMLSQDNLLYTLEIGTQFWKLSRNKEGRLFSFLPLCHIAETLQNIGAGIYLRYKVYFCSSMEKLAEELPEIQPTLLLCVPRIWEKMMEAVTEKIKKKGGFQKKLTQWAFDIGEIHFHKTILKKEKLRFTEKIKHALLDQFVLSNIRKRLGLSKATALVSGAAPLPVTVTKWFRKLGLEIIEDFGQTESTGILCMTQKGQDFLGTIGESIPGLELKISPEGEILTRGRHVFKGYYKDETATAQVLKEGWLYTGDLGEFNSKNQVVLKGRKKEIIKTSGGKMVIPLLIESALKANALINQVCIIGEGKKFISALITLPETVLSTLSESEKDPEKKIVTSEKIISEIKKWIEQVNTSLASYEQIKKFIVLAQEFSIEKAEITPTLKIKKNKIENNYQDLIKMLYEPL